MVGAMPLAGTALLTVTLLGLATACGASEGRSDPPEPAAATTPAAPQPRARLLPVMGEQFRVRGSGFKPRERVRITVTRTTASVGVPRRVRATGRGTFELAVGVRACDGITAVAAGSRGSHASFQFSSVSC